MADKPHPLDIFRSSDQGFDGASRRPRKRRTVSGKVVRTVARSDASRRRAPTASASRTAGSARSRGAVQRSSAKATAPTRAVRPRKGAPSRLGSTRVLAITALSVVGLLALWLWLGSESPDVRLSKPAVVSGPGAAAGSTDAGDTAIPPTAKAKDAGAQAAITKAGNTKAASTKAASTKAASTKAASTTAAGSSASGKPAGAAGRPADPPPAVPPVYSILCATYAGSAEALAADTVVELRARGFGDAGLVGWPDGKDGFSRVELYVGRASSPEALTSTLGAIQGIDDWASGRKPRPFHDARVVEHPNPTQG